MSERNEEAEKREIIKDENGKIVVNTERTTRIEPDSERSVAAAKTTRDRLTGWLAVLVAVLLIGSAGLWWISSRQSAAASPESAEGKEKAGASGEKEAGHSEEAGGHTEGEGEHGAEVTLEPATLAAAGIELEGVTSRPAVALLSATGAIENNPQNTQTISALVGGRIENIRVKVGDYVQRGQVLAVIASPQIAQMHGKLHEAETARGIAERNFERVQRSENRVAVLQARARLVEAEANLGRTKQLVQAQIATARAKLAEAEATLNRTRRLIALGAGAGKDLNQAEANFKVEQSNLQSALNSREPETAAANLKIASAELDFQTNISLNRELQEAKAAVETARVDVKHIRDEMRALGVNLTAHENDREHSQDTALVPVTAPAAGMVTERPVNPGAGIEAGTTLLTVSNLASVFAVASVPETELSAIRVGTLAEISSPAMTDAISARVAYIDPNLNEDTRTGRVRLEVQNPNNRLRAGMFVNIGFSTGTTAAGEELAVNSTAVQRIGEKNVVFVPVDGEPGTFKAQEVKLGTDVGGYTRIISGVELNEKVVIKGSFALKAVMQKGELGDHDH